MNTTAQLANELTHDIQDPFELTVEQAISGDCLVGNMLFVDKGVTSTVLGNASISHQYLCIGKDDDNQPLLLSIHEDNKEVHLVSLTDALKDSNQVNVMPIHSGHKDPAIQELIKQKGKEIADKYVGTTAAHYRMSEETSIKCMAFAAGFAGVSMAAYAFGLPESSEIFDFFATVSNFETGVQGASAMYGLNVGKNMLRYGFSGIGQLATSALANNKKLASFLKSTYKKMTPSEEKLDKHSNNKVFGGMAKSVKDRLYTDKYDIDKTRVTMGEAVQEMLQVINPVVARDFKEYIDVNHIRNVSPSAMFQFLKESKHLGEPKRFDRRDKVWVNTALSVGNVISVANNAKNALNDGVTSPKTLMAGFKGLVKRKQEKHAKLDNQNLNPFGDNKLSIVVNQVNGEPIIQLLDSKSGETKRVIPSEEVLSMMDLVDLESDESLKRKLIAADVIGQEQDVNIDLDNWENIHSAPSM